MNSWEFRSINGIIMLSSQTYAILHLQCWPLQRVSGKNQHSTFKNGSVCQIQLIFSRNRGTIPDFQLDFWSQKILMHPWISVRADFTNRPCRLKPRGPPANCGTHFLSSLCMKLNFIHLVRFRVDNARVFWRVSMNLNITVGQTACRQ